jgi:hypothetical protein
MTAASDTTRMTLEENVESVLAQCPHAIEVRESTGEMNLAASLAVTMAGMSERLVLTEAIAAPAPRPTAPADLKADALELANDLEELIDLTVWQQDCVSRAAELLRKLAGIGTPAPDISLATEVSN